MRKVIAIVLIWAVCGFFAYGLTLGWWTHHSPDVCNTSVAMVLGVTGPVGLFIAVICGQPMHWRLIPLTAEERWSEYQKLYPELTREDFERSRN